MSGTPTTRGRPRDSEIDEAVLAAARDHLASHGFAGMSLGAIAREAGTTRQALYRRWPTKQALAESAIAAIADDSPPPTPVSDPFADLIAELEDFRAGIGRPGRLSLVGAMLQASNDPDVVLRYRSRIIAPRRARLRAILQRGIAAGLLDRGADLAVAVTMLTGSWYARCLAGDAEPDDWPKRTAELVWRALARER